MIFSVNQGVQGFPRLKVEGISFVGWFIDYFPSLSLQLVY